MDAVASLAIVEHKMTSQPTAHHRPRSFTKINSVLIRLVSRACVDNKSRISEEKKKDNPNRPAIDGKGRTETTNFNVLV